MAAEQGYSGYFELISRGFGEEESLIYSESSEEELTNYSDDEIQVPPGDIDKEMGTDIDLDTSTTFDPNYKAVWSSTPPVFRVDKLNFSW